ncbi:MULTISPECIES: hypothetical protein [Streptomyces]|uniref:Uncharacterized protein n=1 Tax=Streptomyces evansiae TaxID=3075535 RepID=A0ABU2QTQ1_9ACTN|nr:MULTISPECIES: hypothetical protein [unclassified Streptomyces]MDT0407710.1 hypothetical protein [Streptomyces sp. DSM 41979]MYQ57366.1 hypothetical protein [Streptomyces sp. SID4926]SCD87438.1 hypothetical protein GA0115252_122628 [Streptomyces sp. DfronAA-171]
MSDTGLDATFIVGLHGVLDKHPWIEQVNAEFDLEEDVFSLAVQRASAFAWSSTALADEQTENLWDHNDAGGDWTPDGAVRQLAWLQASLPRPAHMPGRARREPRLPVLPVFTVLADALRRVGTVRLTGTHTLAPLHRAGDARVALAENADWYTLANPADATTLTVTVSALPSARLAERADAIREAALARTYGNMRVASRKPATAAATPGLARPLAGMVQAERLRLALAFRCDVREWTTDVAAWTTEVFADSIRTVTGLSGLVLIAVSSDPAAA